MEPITRIIICNLALAFVALAALVLLIWVRHASIHKTVRMVLTNVAVFALIFIAGTAFLLDALMFGLAR